MKKNLLSLFFFCPRNFWLYLFLGKKFFLDNFLQLHLVLFHFIFFFFLTLGKEVFLLLLLLWRFNLHIIKFTTISIHVSDFNWISRAVQPSTQSIIKYCPSSQVVFVVLYVLSLHSYPQPCTTPDYLFACINLQFLDISCKQP